MNSLIKQLVRKRRKGGLLIDSNLLLLHLVGDIDPDYIHRVKTTDGYNKSDYESVASVLTAFGSKLFTTPHILAEVSNLANKITSKGAHKSDSDVRYQIYSKLAF